MVAADLAHPTVSLAAGDRASGMARMLGELLAENLRDYPARSRVAARLSGDVTVRATDRDAAITLSFRGGEIVIAEGAAERAPVLGGPWLEMTKVCTGRTSPVRAVARGDIRLQPHGRAGLLLATGYLLSVPSSFYEDDAAARRRRQALLAGAGVAGLAFGVALARRRSRERRARRAR